MRKKKKKETSCLPLVAFLQSIAAFTKNISSVTEQSIQYLPKGLSKTSQITISSKLLSSSQVKALIKNKSIII